MMRHVYRWQFWLPRLLLVVVVLLAAQYVLGLVTRSLAISRGEAAIGGRVEVAHARVSLVDRQVVLGNVRIADPRRPFRNLVEADRCELHFAAGPVLYKRTVIEHGVVSGLRFGTPRTDRGVLSDSPRDARASENAWVGDDAASDAQKWFAQLSDRYGRDLVAQLESVKQSRALCDRWPKQKDSLAERMRQLNQRADELQRKIDTTLGNPLRRNDFLITLPDEIITLQRDFEKIRADIEQLPDVVDAQRRAIVAARRHDERWLRDRLQAPGIDASAVTAYLLRDQVSQPLDEVIGWLRFVRHLVPAERTSSMAAGKRGEDFFFAGGRRSPRLLVRTLKLHGTTRVGGQPVEVRGTLFDFSSTPAVHERPLRLRLATTGSLPLVLQATIDRTVGVVRDELLVDCHGVALPKAILGESDELSLSLAPSRGSVSISIILNGNTLTGDIQLVQKQVQITPNVGGSLSDVPIDAALDETLRDVEGLATRLSISGTLDQPKCTIWSNLGPAVAEALDRALGKAAEHRRRKLLVDSQQRVNHQLTELERMLSEARAELLPQLAQAADELEKIAAQQKSPKRLSTDHVGRRLPANSLFR